MQGWLADNHEYGKGKFHLIKEEPDGQWDTYDPERRKKLLCGRWVDATPGQLVEDALDKWVTCAGCRQKKITLDERPHEEVKRAQNQAEWEARREVERKEWLDGRRQQMRERYARPDWEPLRQKILKRDNYLCQGCHARRATTAHHLTYDRLGSEMDFDLIAVCTPCHIRIHPHLGGAD